MPERASPRTSLSPARDLTCQLLGVLLVALEDLQAGFEQNFFRSPFWADGMRGFSSASLTVLW